MPEYRKKPVTVEAEQFREGEWPYPLGVEKAWISAFDPNRVIGVVVPLLRPRTPTVGGYALRTKSGLVALRDGDWIVTGADGERGVCKAGEFEATYELVP